MSCKNSLVPAELTTLKKKASKFADDLEGDLLDQAESITSQVDGLLTDLENALPKLPEIPDLQTELNKLVGGAIGSAQEALDGVIGDAESALGGQLDALKEKFGDIPGISSVQDLINGNFDPCEIAPKKADGTVKATPPATPSAPPAAPKPKPVQDISNTDLEKRQAASLALKSIRHSLLVLDKIFTNRFDTKIESGSVTRSDAFLGYVRLMSYYDTKTIKLLAEATGIPAKFIAEKMSGRSILSDEEYAETEKDPKKYSRGLVGSLSENYPMVKSEQLYDEKFNATTSWGRPAKVTEYTFDEAISFIAKHYYFIEV